MQIIKTILAIRLHVKDLAVKESFLQCITKARVADPDLSFRIGRGSDLIKCIVFKIIICRMFCIFTLFFEKYRKKFFCGMVDLLSPTKTGSVEKKNGSETNI